MDTSICMMSGKREMSLWGKISDFRIYNMVSSSNDLVIRDLVVVVGEEFLELIDRKKHTFQFLQLS